MDFPPGAIAPCRAVLRRLLVEDTKAVAFSFPVDIRKYPDYLREVKHPMNFYTVDRKLWWTAKSLGVPVESQASMEGGLEVRYSNLEQYKNDVLLIFSNCHAFNGAASVMGQLASRLRDLFLQLLEAWVLRGIPVPVGLPPAPWERPPMAMNIVPPTMVQQVHRQMQQSHPVDTRVGGGKGPRVAAISNANGSRKSKDYDDDKVDSDNNDDDDDDDDDDFDGEDDDDDNEKASNSKRNTSRVKSTAKASKVSGAGKNNASDSDVESDSGSSTSSSESGSSSGSESSHAQSGEEDYDDDDDFMDSKPAKGQAARAKAAKAAAQARKASGAASALNGALKATKPKKARKRPARDLKGMEVIFTCSAVSPNYVDNDEGELKMHFDKLEAVRDWVQRLTGKIEVLMAGWNLEIIRRMVGATKGSIDSYFLTPEFKRLRSKKDVASFLGLSVEEECSQEAAFEVAEKEFGHYFADSVSEPSEEQNIWSPLDGFEGVLVAPKRPLKAPIRINSRLSIISLGRIVQLPRFCTKRHIYPLGFVSEVDFISPRLPYKLTKYRNEVLVDGTKNAPLFRVTDISGGIVKEANSPTMVWSLIIVEILLEMHRYWARMELGVKVSEEVCAQNVLPSNAQRMSSKASDKSAKQQFREKEIKKLLQHLVKKVEANASRAAALENAATTSAITPASVPSLSTKNDSGLSSSQDVAAPAPAPPTDSGNIEKPKAEQAVKKVAPPKKRRPVQLRDLVRVGKIVAETDNIMLSYMGQKFIGNITTSGKIEYEGNFFDAPSAFSIAMKRKMNPTKMADDGWKSCTLNNDQTLDQIKRELTSEDLEAIETLRKQHGESDTSTSAASQSARSSARDAGDADALDEKLKGKGIGDRNYLAGAPDLHLLPQPHKIQWWQVDLTPLVNEQLAKFLFGLDDPIVVDAVEALPGMSHVKNYKFRLQRGTREKDNLRVKKRNDMLETRLEKAAVRILKHQDAVDRRVETATRRQMRIEDRFARNLRAQIKRADRETRISVKKESRESRQMEKKSAQEAVRMLQDELRAFLKVDMEAVAQLRKEILEAKSLEQSPEKVSEESKDNNSSETPISELESKLEALLVLPSLPVDMPPAQRKVAERAAALIDELSKLSSSLDGAGPEKLEEDLSLVSASKSLPLDVMENVLPPEIADSMMEIWDFLSKFAPDLGLCKSRDLPEGLYKPEAASGGPGDLTGMDDGDGDGGEDEDDDGAEDEDEEDEEDDEEEDEEDELDDEDYEDEEEDVDDEEGEGEDDGDDGQAEMDVDAENSGSLGAATRKKEVENKAKKEKPKPSAPSLSKVKSESASAQKNDSTIPSSAAAKGNGPNRKRVRQKRERPVVKTSEEHESVILLPELRKALEECDMSLLGPAHVSLMRFLFHGNTAMDASDAARDRSLSARRFVPVNEATWQEILRYYLIFLVKQLQMGPAASLKETLQDVSLSVNSVMLRAVDGFGRDDDNEEDEPGEELSGNARRAIRRAARLRVIYMRELGMEGVNLRLGLLASVPYSGSLAAEELLQFPEKTGDKVGVYQPPPGLAKIKEAAVEAAAAAAAAVSSTRASPSTSRKDRDRSGTGAKNKTAPLIPPELVKLSSDTIAKFPQWAQHLLTIRDMPTNRGAKIRALLQEVVPIIPTDDEKFATLKNQLSSWVKPGLFKSNAAGPCKRATLNALADAFQNVLAGGQQNGPGNSRSRVAATPPAAVKTRAVDNTPAKRRKKEDDVSMTPDLTQRCRAVTRALSSENMADIFAEPVNTEEFTDYLGIVSRPMDLRTIDRQLVSGTYKTLGDFIDDLDQVWINCKTYNQPGSAIFRLANTMSTAAKKLLKAWVYEEQRVAKSNPFVWETELPPAPWTMEDTIDSGKEPGSTLAPQADGASDSNPTKRKKEKATPATYVLPESLKAKGFVSHGHHVGVRLARKTPDDEFERGTIVAFCKGLHEWHVKFDDDGDAVNMKKQELSAAFDVYTQYTEQKKRARKEKKGKRKDKNEQSSPSSSTILDSTVKKEALEASAASDLKVEGGELVDDSKNAVKHEPGSAPASSEEARGQGKRLRDEDTELDTEIENLTSAKTSEAKRPCNRPETPASVVAGTQSEETTPLTGLASEAKIEVKEEPAAGADTGNAEAAPIPDNNLLSLTSFAEYAFVGGIVIKWFPDFGCAEGAVTLYDDETRKFTLTYQLTDTDIVTEEVSKEELLELERNSALLKVGSDRNGVEDEEKELERISSLDPLRQRCYRRANTTDGKSKDDNEAEDEDEDLRPPKPLVNGEEMTGDALAPAVFDKYKELHTLRRLVVALGTKRYEDIDLSLRTVLLRLLCEQVAESGSIRDVVDERLLIMIKTRSKWKDLPPVIEFHDKKEESKPSELELSITNFTETSMQEQPPLERQLASIRTEGETVLSKSVISALQRVEEDLNKMKKKKQAKEDARRWRMELEFKLQVLNTRPKLLGQDRYFNQYMIFPGDGSKIFVRLGQLSAKQGLIDPKDAGWRVIVGLEAIEKVMRSLNPKGVREGTLLQALQARASIFVRGRKSATLWRTQVSKSDTKELKDAPKSMVGAFMASLGKSDNPARFYEASQAGIVIGPEAVARHVKAVQESTPDIMRNGGFSERVLLDIKVYLLNIEFAVVLTRPEDIDTKWMLGKRKGWIRLVTSACEWRDLRQACCALEVGMQEFSVPLENFFPHLYGDAGFALRTRTGASLAARVSALDAAINHADLSRQAVARATLLRASAKRRKKRKR